jgi:hypothetical protein
MGGSQILTAAPTVSRTTTMEEAQAWSARKIKELELVVSAAVVTGAKDTYWPVLTVGQQLQILTAKPALWAYRFLEIRTALLSTARQRYLEALK